MKNTLQRILSAALCLMFIISGIPAWSEAEAPAALTLTEEIALEESLPPVPESEENEIPAEDEEILSFSTEQMLVEAIGEDILPEGDAENTSVSREEQLAAAIADLMSRLQEKGYESQYEKALWIYRMAIENITPGEGEDAANAIVDMQANALGYARALEALMTAAGMECMVISGDETSWNIARLDGEWTHIDAYADDVSGNAGAHFGLTDAAMARSRSWDASVLPECSAAQLNYHVREEGYSPFLNKEGFALLLAFAIENEESQIKLYNAGEAFDLAQAAQEILAEIAPNTAALVHAEGALASISLNAIEVAKAPVIPEKIVPEKASISIGIGEKLSVAGWTLLPEGAQDTVSYSSKAKSIASVDAEGMVTGKKAGKTTLTLKTAGGLKCTVTVSVKKKPSKVTLVAPRAVLGLEETMQLSRKLSSGSASQVTYTSLTPEIASVTPTGEVTALATGTAIIHGATYNGKQDTIEILVVNAPDQVTLSEETRTLGVKDSFTLAYALPEGSAGTVEYISSDESIAIVDQNGKVTALSTGEAEEAEANIIARAYNGKEAICRVTVKPAPAKLYVAAERKTIGIGEQIQLKTSFEPENAEARLQFKSSKSSIASVNSEGLVTGKKAGSATITVTAHNKKTATIKITVKKAPKSIAIISDRNVLGLGESMQLGYKITSGAAGKVTFDSLTPDIATVSPAGEVTALAKGTASIYAATFNGKEAVFDIQVADAPETVILSEESRTLGVKDSFTLAYTLPEGSAGAVEFISGDESIAIVDQNGKVTALSTGEADSAEVEIIARAYNGAEGVCRVTVVPAPAKVMLSAERKTIGIGEKLQLNAAYEPEYANAALQFKSSKSSIASVNSEGIVTGKKAGSATITVTAHNKKTATIKITVKAAPKSIAIVSDQDVLGLGESLQLGYKITSSSAGKVSFDSLTPEVASVTPEGVVNAHHTGTAIIHASTFNGKEDTIEIPVMKAPESVSLNQTSFILGTGATAFLAAEVNEGSAGRITYASDDESIAKIDSVTGKITAMAPGTTRVHALTHVPGVSAWADITVYPAPSFVSLPYTTVYLGIGDTLQLEPEIDEGAVTTLSYSRSTSKYISISEDGLVTAKAVGDTTITVKTHNGKSCKMTLKARKAPTWVKLNPADLVLGLGESAQISAQINSGYATTFTFENLTPDVLSFNEDQAVTGIAVGEGQIQVTTHNGLSAICNVQILPAPEAIGISGPQLLGVGMEGMAGIEVLPAGSFTHPVFSVVSGDAITISDDGLITAVAPGKAVVRASTHLEDVYAEYELAVVPAPESVALSKTEYTVNIDETLQLKPIIPDGSFTEFTYEAAKDSFFTLDENGLITPIRRGTTAIRVTTHNGLSVVATITVNDPYYPEDMSMKNTPPEYLGLNESFTPTVSVSPSSAIPAIEWTSSDPDIVKVDAKTGKATGISSGRATITGVSQRNPSLSISYKLIVLSDSVCLKLPYTRTYTKSISTTLNQIKAVRSSAYSELEKLYIKGEISESDYKSRKNYITRAFDMHLMPWMTKTKELYWKAANSEDGLKDFKTTMVYYGLPYTQTNRRFNKDKAISKGYFTDSGNGYYLLQGSKFTSRMYPGNDCSSYASMAVWGMDHSNSFHNTRDIASSGSYRTLTDWKDLRPGDLLNKGGNHVVMFLYYTNKAKTQMMIIEQGGSTSKERGVDNAAYSNTIACSIKDVEYYTSRSYKIRRVKSLGY